MRLKENLFLLCFFIPSLLIGGCSSDIAGAPCETNEQCPSGQYCGEDKICHKGTKPIKDAGIDAGRDAGKDGGRDIGADAIEPLDISDISVDSNIPDIGYEDAIIVDSGEDGISDTFLEDAITDISEDTGNDISINVRNPSLYDMSSGITKSQDYTIKSVTGHSAKPVININGTKIYETKQK